MWTDLPMVSTLFGLKQWWYRRNTVYILGVLLLLGWRNRGNITAAVVTDPQHCRKPYTTTAQRYTNYTSRRSHYSYNRAIGTAPPYIYFVVRVPEVFTYLIPEFRKIQTTINPPCRTYCYGIILDYNKHVSYEFDWLNSWYSDVSLATQQYVRSAYFDAMIIQLRLPET